MKKFLVIAGLLLSPHAMAADAPRVWYHDPIKVWFAATSLTGGFNSSVLTLDGFTRLKMYLTATDANSTMTSVTATCYDNITSSVTNPYSLQSCSVASGACTSSDITLVKSISGTKRWEWILDVSGLTYVHCAFTAAGTITASVDTLTGYYQLGSFP